MQAHQRAEFYSVIAHTYQRTLLCYRNVDVVVHRAPTIHPPPQNHIKNTRKKCAHTKNLEHLATMYWNKHTQAHHIHQSIATFAFAHTERDRQTGTLEHAQSHAHTHMVHMRYTYTAKGSKTKKPNKQTHKHIGRFETPQMHRPSIYSSNHPQTARRRGVRGELLHDPMYWCEIYRCACDACAGRCVCTRTTNTHTHVYTYIYALAHTVPEV